VLLALALAVHHQAAGLSAALPPTARVDPAILVRFARHGALVLAASAVGGYAAPCCWPTRPARPRWS
jgi:hypothetical protein